MTLIHRPSGIGHPYAHSADQRIPVHPSDSTPIALGVIADQDYSTVSCEWVSDHDAPLTLSCVPGSVAASDAAALAGGDGHLAQAQAEQLSADGAWQVTTPPVRLGLRYRYRFTGITAQGLSTETPWFTVSAGQWSQVTPSQATLTVDGVPAATHPLIDPALIEWWIDEDGPRRVRFAFHLNPQEHVVGFGERYDHVDQRGRHLDAVVFEQYKSQGATGRTYLPMPFAHVIGAEGWGFHVRTSRRTWFDVGASTPERLIVEAALPDPSSSDSAALDMGIYRGTPSEVVAAFTAEVGRAEELPDWVLRLWASGNEWNTQQLVLDRMNSHQELDIPVGVIVIEAWSDEEGITIFRDAHYRVHPDGAPHQGSDFTYPAAGAWPDPKAMIDELHSRGIKVILWQIPLLKTSFDLPDAPDTAQVFTEGHAMVAAGHAIQEADGSAYHNRGWWFPQSLMADFSTAEGRAWWTERRRYLVEDLDVDGFKTDGGEHAWGDELRYADGTRGDESNNLNPVRYAQAFGDLLRSCGKAPVTFSRAGFTGAQAHGIHWAGDEDSTWQAFQWSMTAGITASACGIVYWGWDLAGFSGPVPDPELYLRATAAATFNPIMQYHSEFNHHQLPLRDRTPWFVAQTHDAPQVVDVFRGYAKLRDRLVPYLSRQARLSVTTGAPLLRGLFIDFAADPAIWEHSDEFLLGSDLLVHPVTAPDQDTWETYLPAGAWVDAWTGQLIDPNATDAESIISVEADGTGMRVTRRVPLTVIPVYVRAEAWAELRDVFLAED